MGEIVKPLIVPGPVPRVRTITMTVYRCSRCGRQWTTRGEAEDHIANEHGAGENTQRAEATDA